MSYLPPGWTEERLAAATADDLKALPYETLHLIPPHKINSHDAQDVIFGARIDHHTQEERARFNLEPFPPLYKPGVEDPATDPVEREVKIYRKRQYLDDERKRYFEELAKGGDEATALATAPATTGTTTLAQAQDPVVQVVEDRGYDDFGFLLVRLAYDNEARWNLFDNSVLALVDGYLAKAEGGERITDKMLLLMVEDELLDGTGFFGAVTYCEELRDYLPPRPGLDTSMILVVDNQSLSSFLEPTPPPGQEPWVWAVDMMYPFEVRQQPPLITDPLPRQYPGYFRVSLSTAVLDLWPYLMVGIHGSRMWSWDPFSPVWDGLAL